MPRPRFAKLSRQKQQAILGAAMEEFAAQGYQQASYNRIIERAGVSKGAMYYYFDDKEDLYSTVVLQVTEHIIKEFELLPQVETPDQFWQALRAFMTRALSFMREHPVVVGVMKSALSLYAAGSTNAAVAEGRRLYREWAESFLRQAQALGAVRSDLPFDLLVAITVAISSAGDMWISEHFEELGPEELDRVGDHFLDLIRRALEAR
jgi:AcrR family transcriptional regulator